MFDDLSYFSRSKMKSSSHVCCKTVVRTENLICCWTWVCLKNAVYNQAAILILYFDGDNGDQLMATLGSSPSSLLSHFHIPFGYLTSPWKITIFNRQTIYKWAIYTMAMLNNQMVVKQSNLCKALGFIPFGSYPSHTSTIDGPEDVSTQPQHR